MDRYRNYQFWGWLTMACAIATGFMWATAVPKSATAAPTFQFNPITTPSTITFASTAVLDVDGDGDLEIFTADSSSRVFGWDHRGNSLPGYPFYLNSYHSRIDGPLAAADLNLDGTLDLIAGARGNSGDALGERGKVYAWPWNKPGQWLSGWPREMYWNGAAKDAEVYTVALGNVTGDGALEVIAGTNDSNSDSSKSVNVWTAGGADVSGFPVGYKTAGIWGHVAAADLVGDGHAEIITGRDHLYLHAYSGNGSQIPGFPVRTTVNVADENNNSWGTYPYLEFTRGAPVIGDIDGDGQPEIVIAGKMRNANHVVTNNGLIAVEANGTRVRGWESAVIVGGDLASTFSSKQAPSLADLTGDGKLEIIVGFRDGKIRAYRHDKTLLWEYDYAMGKKLYASEAAVGDITGDGQVDIVFGTYNPDENLNRADVRLIALDRNGKLISGFPLTLPNEDNSPKSGIRSAPTLADLDGDCDVEIIAASSRGVIYVWDLAAPYFPNKMPWPTARHDNWRTGWTAGSALFGSHCPTSGGVSATPTAQPSPTPTAQPSLTSTAQPSPTPQPSPTIPPASGVSSVAVRVSRSADDAEERNDGSVNLTSSDLELVDDAPDRPNQTVGMRFSGLAIPPGATITNAYIEFTTDETGGGSIALTVAAEAADNAASFSTSSRNVSGRPRTAAVVAWNNLPTWATVGEQQRTPNLAALVQEVVGRSGWRSGNALAIVVTGSGERVAAAYDGSASAAPLLVVEFRTGGAPTAVPTVAPSATPTAVPPTPTQPPAGNAQTVTVQVSASTDDAEESGGVVSLSSSDLELVDDTPDRPNQTVGLRFAGLAVPPGATITEAYVEFETDETGSGATALVVRAEAVDSATTFSGAANNLSGRPTTAAAISWNNLPSWNTVNERHRTPNLAAVVQEVVSRSGWQSGNALAILITGSGKRTAESYEGEAANAPKLIITFATGGRSASSPTPTTPPSTPPSGNILTFEAQVVNSQDDAEETLSSGFVKHTSSDLELGEDNGAQMVGVRFQNVTIPPGATIVAAWLAFEVDVPSSGSTAVTIWAEAADSATAFSTAPYNLTQRSQTANSTSWQIPAWNEANTWQQSPDLTAVVQEVVGRGGWQSGNSLVFLIAGTGQREAESYNGGAAAAPKLHIEYSLP